MWSMNGTIAVLVNDS